MEAVWVQFRCSGESSGVKEGLDSAFRVWTMWNKNYLFLNSERASSSLLRRYIEASKYKTVSKMILVLMLSCEPSLWILVFTIWSTPIGCSRGDVVSFSCQAAPTSGDTGFLNSFFPDWFSWPAEQRLPFRYNALRTMYWWLAQTLAIFASRGALSVNTTSMQASSIHVYRCRNRTITSCLWQDSLRYDRNNKNQDSKPRRVTLPCGSLLTFKFRFTHSNPGYWQSLGPLKAKGNFARTERGVFGEWTAMKKNKMITVSECMRQIILKEWCEFGEVKQFVQLGSQRLLYSVECFLIADLLSGFIDAFDRMKVLHFCSSPKPWDPDAKKGDLEQTLERWRSTSMVRCVWWTVSSYTKECFRLARLYITIFCVWRFFFKITEGRSVQSMKASPTSVTDGNELSSMFPWACHYTSQSDVLHVSQEGFFGTTWIYLNGSLTLDQNHNGQCLGQCWFLKTPPGTSVHEKILNPHRHCLAPRIWWEHYLRSQVPF